MMDGKYKGLICRGDWSLGTACGKCEKCLETKPASAGKVDQDVREAAAELWRLLEEHPRAESILSGQHDQAQTVQILARMKEAGRQAGLREAAEALKPFADCMEYIADDEDDDEWAKFRLEIKDYRRARRILDAITALIEPAPCPPPPASS